MGKTAIDWATDVWNPVTGCTKLSAGCQNCYAERMAKRLAGRYGYPADEPFKVTVHPEKLALPKQWKKPRRIFVNSMSDLFHEDVPDLFIADVFMAMELAKHHTFMVLTKRPERMKCLRLNGPIIGKEFPRNIWLGVTAENQEQADKRIPILLQTPAAVRWVSVEPMLTTVNLNEWLYEGTPVYPSKHAYRRRERLNWVVAGGETGPGARPIYLQWILDLRDQCKFAKVPFFFKSWGTWAKVKTRELDGQEYNQFPTS